MGEHIHVRFGCLFTHCCPLPDPPARGVTDMDRFGEIERSRENRTDEEDEPQRLTRVGEVGRWNNVVVEREEKLELEDAKAEEEE